VLLVGLTGGIGSGKSTVAEMLVARGAILVDADKIAREVVAPGGPAYQPVIDRFGSAVLAADGTLDRPALADIVFRDAGARKDLEAITHPAVGQIMAERIAERAGTPDIVVLDIPLLAEKGRMGVAHVIVVDCPEDIAVQRLVAYRGFDESDARRRVEAQLTREQRGALADVVVDNSGDRALLESAVDGLWAWLEERR
jgi:dephospho-CoA kinase